MTSDEPSCGPLDEEINLPVEQDEKNCNSSLHDISLEAKEEVKYTSSEISSDDDDDEEDEFREDDNDSDYEEDKSKY